MKDPKILRLRDRFLTLMGHNHQWSQLFDLLPDVSFFVKDRQGRFMALNRKGCEYCGVASEAAAIGMTDHDFVLCASGSKRPVDCSPTPSKPFPPSPPACTIMLT
jgi:PAS domain-containing protein